MAQKVLSSSYKTYKKFVSNICRFSENKTWFTSIGDVKYLRLADDSGSCQCKNGHCGCMLYI